MATWAIGDIHGCWQTLQRLLERIEWNTSTDRLWLVGDLVNRGPKSLQTLRTVKSMGANATVVLGNHDLHLLALAADNGVSLSFLKQRKALILGEEELQASSIGLKDLRQESEQQLVAWSDLGSAVAAALQRNGYSSDYWNMGVQGAMFQMIAHGIS